MRDKWKDEFMVALALHAKLASQSSGVLPIELPVDELRNVVRSAYQHRFPYRYSCRDEILRRFCPLPDYGSCRKFVADRAASHAG